MTESTFVETVDMRERQTLRWGLLRAMFPDFVEDVELGRYLKKLLARRHVQAVQLLQHVDVNGAPSPHVLDVYALEREAPA